MSYETYSKTIELAVKMNEKIALSGGEPTIHPQFLSFLEMAIKKSKTKDYNITPYVHTNGKNKRISLMLLELAKKRKVVAGISLDKWHDPIDEEVKRSFQLSQGFYVFVRDVSKSPDVAPQKSGRCEDGYDFCPMFGTPFIDVDGSIHECGCENAPEIGHIADQKAFLSKYKEHKWGCANNLPCP
jgi:MoaA/NifB/PqqE/SkfB family radical SAM enzyme